MTNSFEDAADLVHSLKNGDKQALGELFSQYQGRLERMVDMQLDRRLKGRIDAADILQEAYIDAENRIQHYLNLGDDTVPFYVWLRRITGQTMIDVHRRHLGAKMRDAGREVKLQGGGDSRASALSLADLLVGQLTSPSQGAMRAELLEEVASTLETLQPIDREILTLRHFEELSNSEAAAVLEIEPAAASVRYVRALKRLKQALPHLLGGDPADAPPSP